MNYTKNVLIVFFLIFINAINAQDINKKIQLQWKNKTKITNSYGDLVAELPLLSEKLFSEDFIPYYFEQWSVKGDIKVRDYNIKNIIYENINKNLFPNESQNNFPNELESSFVIKKARDKAFAQLKIIPLVLKNGQLKRIVSFELEYSFKPKIKFKNINSLHDSPLSSGDWYKFAIDTTGVYKLSKSFLRSIGVNINSVNPKNIKLYGNGGARIKEANSAFHYDGLQENAIYINGEDDNSFDDNDYILFYAQGPDIWQPNVITRKARHQKNIYSNKAYYFIHIANDNGKRIELQETVVGTPDVTISTFNDYAIHEKEITNLDHFGQQFFGENFTVNDTQNFSLNFKDIDLTQDISIRFSTGAISDELSNFKLFYDSEQIIINTLGAIASTTVGSTTVRNTNITAINEILNFEVKYDNQGNPSAKGYLDYIEINGVKKLIARNTQFSFRNFNFANTSIVGEYVIENKDNIFQVWNVSDKINPKLIENSSNTGNNFTFLANGGELKEYIVINENDYYSPIKLRSSYVENQNLHAIQDIDYLVITKDELLQQANRLANYHEENNGLSTLVLTEQIIYNEFSSGAKDPMAIRNFIKHLYENSSTPEKRIKYVLMFGDTSFDFQNIENNNRGINVIAYQSKNSTSLANSYVTDDFFVMLDDNEGDFYNYNGSGDLLDVAIGRIPVKNRLEAETAVDKTLKYYSVEAFGKWRNSITLLADDIDKPSEDVFTTNLDTISYLISLYKPSYNLTKLYSDAYVQELSSGGESYPQVKQAITNTIEQGTLVVDYFGHGGQNGLTEERIFDINQIQNLYNPTTLPLFITITCEFSRFDDPTRVSAGERLFSNENGGSVNMITTAREVYISEGRTYNIDVMKDVLELNYDEDNSIAQSLAKSKNRWPTLSSQRLFINFFGDPAMKLARPKPKVKITHMNDVDISEELDTIKALSHVYFRGVVTNNTDDVLTGFNGNLSISVYDKATTRTTLNNDSQNSNTIDFSVRESRIFNGRATVTDGNWEFDFIAPRDIRIAYGSAKLSFYAENQVIDKNGYNTDIIIGGINYDAPEDNVGPQIKLYMNDESFIDGGNTNENPVFLAILEDESGINTSFTAVDHDIVGILDGDQSNPIIMNDYFETEPNDFKKGKVKFPFRDLSVGLHTITFKCWDSYNNPSEASLNFVVVSDSELILDNVLNYPNPFINYTEFWFNHNKPNETLDVQVQIFTVSGKLIKTINKQITTSESLSRSLTWNGLDDFGNKIGKGVYIYKLNVKAISSGLKAEKIEKLVILQ